MLTLTYLCLPFQLFFICHTPRFVLNVHEFLTLESLRKSIDHDCNDISLWALVCASVSHFLMTLNSSVNFFIYCFMCATFRRLLFRLVFRKFLGGIVVFICTCGRGAGDDAEGSVRWRPRWVPNAITRYTNLYSLLLLAIFKQLTSNVLKVNRGIPFAGRRRHRPQHGGEQPLSHHLSRREEEGQQQRGLAEVPSGGDNSSAVPQHGHHYEERGGWGD